MNQTRRYAAINQHFAYRRWRSDARVDTREIYWYRRTLKGSESSHDKWVIRGAHATTMRSSCLWSCRGGLENIEFIKKIGCILMSDIFFEFAHKLVTR